MNNEFESINIDFVLNHWHQITSPLLKSVKVRSLVARNWHHLSNGQIVSSKWIDDPWNVRHSFTPLLLQSFILNLWVSQKFIENNFPKSLDFIFVTKCKAWVQWVAETNIATTEAKIYCEIKWNKLIEIFIAEIKSNAFGDPLSTKTYYKLIKEKFNFGAGLPLLSKGIEWHLDPIRHHFFISRHWKTF